MKNASNARRFTLLAICGLFLALALCACSNTADLETQVSGKWRRTHGEGVVDINLATTPKTLIVDGQSYNAEIEGIDKGNYTVNVKVQTSSGQPEVWSLIQKWNDNGSSFNLAFRHNGTTETLTPADQS